jgi:hypothetical protein
MSAGKLKRPRPGRSKIDIAVRKTADQLVSEEKLIPPPKPEPQTVLALGPTVDAAGRSRMHMIRRQAAIDFITDPDEREVAHHFTRADRDYPKYIGKGEFMVWCQEDQWRARRSQFWDEIGERLLQRSQDQLLEAQRLEIEQLAQLREYLGEHLTPLLEEGTNKVRRYPSLDSKGKPHPLAGKPILPHGISSYDKAIKAFLEVDQRLMLKRGEVTDRTENAAEVGDGEQGAPGTSSLDPVTRSVKFSAAEVRAMSRQVLLMRQPELNQPLAIDVDGEADQDGDDTI